MTRVLHPLAEAWLTRLDAVAASLPPEEAAELRADLRDHLAHALPADADAEAVRAVLRDLGEPEDAVEAAAPPAASALAGEPTGVATGQSLAGAPPPRPALAQRDVVTLVLLAGLPLLAAIPVLGLVAWVVVLVLVLRSGWSRWARVTACVPLGIAALVIAMEVLALVPSVEVGAFSMSGPEWVFMVILFVPFGLPVSVVTALLIGRGLSLARREAALHASGFAPGVGAPGPTAPQSRGLRSLDVLVLVGLVLLPVVPGYPVAGALLWAGLVALVLCSGWTRADKLLAAVPLLLAGLFVVLQFVAMVAPAILAGASPRGGDGVNMGPLLPENAEALMVGTLLAWVGILPISIVVVGVLVWRLLRRR